MLPKVSSIPLKERISVLHVERGRIDVRDGAVVVIDKTGVRTHLPLGGTACLVLEPGTRISHAAVTMAARCGTLIQWCGEGGVRVYSAGRGLPSRSDRLLWQAANLLDERARLRVVRKMYELRFGTAPPAGRSIEQLRGLEGARVRQMYKALASQYGIVWRRREYDPNQWAEGDYANRALSAATACLYGITEAAIHTAGYSTGMGFIHTGKPLSFVYDIADVFKFEIVVPVAFSVARSPGPDLDGEVRRRCRDMFRKHQVLERIIPLIEEILKAGGLAKPMPGAGTIGPAFIEDDPFEGERP